jgi:hypothetical protein
MAVLVETVQLPRPVSFDEAALWERWLPDDPFRYEQSGVEGYYATKAAIGAWLEPETVLEIGVRAGYSAFAFWSGYRFRRFYGYDSDRGEWGGVKGYAKAADRLLMSLGVEYCLQLQDTQRLAALTEPVAGIDLAHVDGDHSWGGAKHDINLCLNAGARFVVVDDYHFVPAVKVAADDVVRERHLSAVAIEDALGRGNLVIANTGIQFPPLPTT